MKRNFRSLSAREALHVAIFIEERNAEIYHRFGEMFAEFRDTSSAEIAHAFWEMAAEERNHAILLQKRYRDRYGVQPCHVTEDDIREFVEVPRLEVGNLLSARRNARGPTVREKALEVAREAEHQALIFYKQLAQVTTDARMRAVYREFAEFEGEHCNWIQRKSKETKAAACAKQK